MYFLCFSRFLSRQFLAFALARSRSSGVMSARSLVVRARNWPSWHVPAILQVHMLQFTGVQAGGRQLDDDDPLKPGRPDARVDVNRVIRELMVPARVALAPHMPELPREEAIALLGALIDAIEHNMPVELQKQDARLQEAKTVLMLAKF
jgi:hypothetical protein